MKQANITQTLPPCPDRPADSHKGMFGRVVVIGGSPTMPGAAGLCASAALRGGCGLATVAAPAGVLETILSIEPSATGLYRPDELGQLQKEFDKLDPSSKAVLAIGPGLGQSRDVQRLVGTFISANRRVVLDADGLNALAENGKVRSKALPELVLTPHPGEFARLARPLGIQVSGTDPQQRPEAAMKLAQAQRCIVVLKGHGTVVTDGERLYMNTTGNPALATAGSGDVLTGLIASLIAQGMTPFDASVLGVYLHGMAGDLWAQQHGPSGMTGRDLIGLLPQAMNLHRSRG